MNVNLKLAVVATAGACFLLVALAYSSAQTENNAGAEQQVRKVEEERRQAVLRNDIKALDLLIAPDYTAVMNLFGGKVITKTDELALDQPDATAGDCSPSFSF
jgi:hypothetical protein